MAHKQDQGHGFILLHPNRNAPVPLLGSREVKQFVASIAVTDDCDHIYLGQILHHLDGVTNVHVTHPTANPMISVALPCVQQMYE